MTDEQIAALRPGDVVKNLGSHHTYIVISINPVVAVRSVSVHHADEWERVGYISYVRE
jgi:hypothetical protein